MSMTSLDKSVIALLSSEKKKKKKKKILVVYIDLIDSTVPFLCSHQELEEFWPFKALLTELTRRLTYCVQAELIPLMEVAGVMEVSLQLSVITIQFFGIASSLIK